VTKAARTPFFAHGRANEHEVPRSVGDVVDARHGRHAEHRRALEVGRRDTPAVPGGQDVVQRDEPELARVRRRARDDHAARLEQRPEALLARCARRTDRGGPRRVGDLDERVDGYGPAVHDDEGVEVDRRDVGALLREAGQAPHHRAERVAVDCGLAPERPEQPLRREVVGQAVGVGIGERDEPERDVADRLGEHAPDAEHHARPELRVAHEAGDQLARSVHHRRDEQLDVAVVRCGGREELASRAAHRLLVTEVQADEPALGLVRDRVTAQLHDDREAEVAGGGRGLVGSGCGPLVEHRDAVVRHQSLRRGFGEGRHGRRG
jgi:hypothetical protein